MEFCQEHLEAAYKTAEKYYGSPNIREILFVFVFCLFETS
jgi:hypothetical protein